MKYFITYMFLISTSAMATNIDCRIDDNIESVNQVYKISTQQGRWNQLYKKAKIEYKVSEWWPDIQRPIQLFLKISIDGKTNFATGSANDYVQVSVFDDNTFEARTLQCWPTSLNKK